jgi:transposase
MSYGLLKGALRPVQEVCALRVIIRQCDMLLNSQARHVQHMQKALTAMNVLRPTHLTMIRHARRFCAGG